MTVQARPAAEDAAEKADRLWTPTPAQREFLRRREYEALYGGAKGGGKTDALIYGGTRQIHHPRYHAAIFRESYPQLQEIMDRMAETFPDLGGEWNESKKRWTFPSGARFSCFYLQREKDKKQHDGKEYQYLAFDQVERFTESMYTYLIGCSRSSVAEIEPQVRSSANPGGVGHLWVKRRFIELGPYNTYRDPETGLTRVFVPAKVWDNPHIMEHDPAYVQRLLGLPEGERAALLEGDWDVFAGQFFDEWNADIHVVPIFEPPDWWDWVGGMDWGYANPSVVLGARFDQFGRGFACRELTFTRKSPVEAAHLIAQKFDGLQMTVYCDPSMGRRMYESGVTIIDAINEELAELGSGVVLVKAEMSSTDARVSGWQRVHDFLHPGRESPEGDGTSPWFTFMRGRCPYTTETLPSLVHDEDKPEDMADSQHDHGADALRYMLESRPPLAERPENLRPFDSHRDRVSKQTRKILEQMQADNRGDVELERRELLDRYPQLRGPDSDVAETFSS